MVYFSNSGANTPIMRPEDLPNKVTFDGLSSEIQNCCNNGTSTGGRDENRRGYRGLSVDGSTKRTIVITINGKTSTFYVK